MSQKNRSLKPRSRTAANSITLPNSEPWAVREQIVVLPICSREVARAQRSGVRLGEDAL